MNELPLHELTIDQLPVRVYPTNRALGQAAARQAAVILSRAILTRGEANLILATGNSQLTFLEALRSDTAIDWPKINIFHMDEYIGIDPLHPASFPHFLRQHLVNHIPVKSFFPIQASQAEIERTIQAYEALLRTHPADLCVLGIGENGHLAFNDPPFADFQDPVWVKVVKLDEASRLQQVGEGHFASLAEVPTHALTLTIPALLASEKVLAVVPERRKAEAVQRALFGPLTTQCPASILRQSPHALLYLDVDSAGLLDL